MDKRGRFEAQVLPHLDAAYRLSLSLARSRADAEDLVQDAALRAYRAIETLRASDAKAWFLAIVRNCYFSSRDVQRKRAAVPLPDHADQETPAALIEPSPDPQGAAMQDGDRRAVGHSISKLAEEHREVLVLREIEELSYREIASVIGAPMGTVMSRLARARAALKEQWLLDHGECDT